MKALKYILVLYVHTHTHAHINLSPLVRHSVKARGVPTLAPLSLVPPTVQAVHEWLTQAARRHILFFPLTSYNAHLSLNQF